MTLEEDLEALDDPMAELELVDGAVARDASEPPADDGEPVESVGDPLVLNIDAQLPDLDVSLGDDA